MAFQRQVIACVAVGCMGRYVCEELLADDRFDVVVISRHRSEWFTARNITVYESDYSLASMLSILNSANATTLLSFLNLTDSRYITIHQAFLSACLASKSCRRLIPSEFAGNVEEFPNRPRNYGSTREPFRKILANEAGRVGEGGVEWTLLECGWFMDYFLPKEKSYMKPVPEFPINVADWTVMMRGTGDEPQSWTLGREVAKAEVALCAVESGRWDPVTYVAGQWGNFNEAMQIIETFYNRPLRKLPARSASNIRKFLQDNAHRGEDDDVQTTMCEESCIDGANYVPRQRTMDQRKRLFKDIKFSTIREVLERAEGNDFL